MRWLLIVAALLLTGCVTQKRCEKKFPPSEFSRVDSVYIYRDVVKWKDTVIYKDLPPVIIEKYVPIKDTLKLTGNYSEALSWVVGGNILGSLKEGKNPVKIEYKIKEVEVVKEVEKIEYKEKIVNVRYVPKWLKILAIVGSLSIIAWAIYIFIRIRY